LVWYTGVLCDKSRTGEKGSKVSYEKVFCVVEGTGGAIMESEKADIEREERLCSILEEINKRVDCNHPRKGEIDYMEHLEKGAKILEENRELREAFLSRSAYE
jgi:hypothetical protein